MGDDRGQHDDEHQSTASELDRISAQPPSFAESTATDSIYDGRNSRRPDTEIARVSSSTQAVVESLDYDDSVVDSLDDDEDSNADDLGDDDRSISRGGVDTENGVKRQTDDLEFSKSSLQEFALHFLMTNPPTLI